MIRNYIFLDVKFTIELFWIYVLKFKKEIIIW